MIIKTPIFVIIFIQINIFLFQAQIESKNFDRLQSVLYGELSAESKKLRALVRISEAKLAIHKEK